MKNDSVTGKQNSKVQKKIKILFIAEGVVLSELVRHSQKGNLSQKNVSISA